MSSDEQAFLAAIDATPEDEAPRLVYADWLDEQDRPEDATRQRQWMKAYHFIKTFTREYEDKEQYDDEGERIGAPNKATYAKIMDEVEWWKNCVTGKEQSYGLGGSIGFGTDSAPDRLENSATRREFWRCFQVLTGVEAPEELRQQERYRCAC